MNFTLQIPIILSISSNGRSDTPYFKCMLLELSSLLIRILPFYNFALYYSECIRFVLTITVVRTTTTVMPARDFCLSSTYHSAFSPFNERTLLYTQLLTILYGKTAGIVTSIIFFFRSLLFVMKHAAARRME